MKYSPPYGSSNPNASYINATPGQKGSPVPAEAIEAPQREIVNAIIAAGLVPSSEDQEQLWKAINKSRADKSSVNPVADTLALRYTDGRLKVSAAVAADDAVNLAALLAFPAQGGGLNVQGGHVYVDFAGMPTDKFEQMLKTIRVPIWLTANKTWYVRTDGNDANDGSANTAAKAFRTIQGALNYVSENFNLGSYTGTIRVLQGQYNEHIILPKYNASTGVIYIIGESENETIVKGGVTGVTSAGTYYIQNLTVKNFGTAWLSGSVNDILFYIPQGVTVHIANVAADFTTALTSASAGQVFFADGSISIGPNVSAELGVEAMVNNVFISQGGVLRLQNNITINGAILGAFCWCLGLGRFSRGTALPIVSGTVAGGSKYRVEQNSICASRGGGADYFPGTNPGTTATGGQYS